jgi:hypothetical protein
MNHFTPDDVVTAALYSDWWGTRDNCLRVPTSDQGADGTSYGPGSKLDEARAVCRQAPALLRLQGPRGPGRILGVVGQRVIFVADDNDSVMLLPAEVGGFTTQKVAQYVLGPTSPSQWIRGCYDGGTIALTRADAHRLGFPSRRHSALPQDDDEVRLFGCNVVVI